ncbi:hypothetical protein BaRGS_00039765 [Batillaria attramentaria]|uniref:Uncharacterized protein n=1 Tax=Batillaria attramentaria TaxID=370345 RepID=A0ABD0J2M1_9CAEN
MGLRPTESSSCTVRITLKAGDPGHQLLLSRLLPRKTNVNMPRMRFLANHRPQNRQFYCIWCTLTRPLLLRHLSGGYKTAVAG